MSLYDDLTLRREAARRSHDSATLDALQMILSAAKNEQITMGHVLSDEELQAVIGRQVKQLKDARNDFVAGGRNDLITKTDQEISLLEQFLPQQLSEDALTNIVSEVMGTFGETVSAKDAGQIMGKVMARVKGQADGNRVREIVNRLISK